MKASTDRISVTDIDYIFWIEDNEKDILSVKPLEYNPKISIVVPIYNANESILTECIESVIAQTYENWELILVDDASTLTSVRPILEKYGDNEGIRVIYRSENGNISVATNDGIKIAKGEFIGFLDNDDLLAPNALYEVACKLNENRELAFIYSDEDKISEDGTKRMQPFFKPDWSPDTLLSYNYCNHFSIYRRDMIEQTGILRSEYNGAQDYDFVLRFTENCTQDKIGHIPRILYHWRVSATSTSAGNENKSYVKEASKRVKEETLKRRGISGHTEWIEDVKEYRIVYDTQDSPLVSIVILSKDNLPILKQCIDSIEALTEYKNYELIVVDNGSVNKDEVSEYLKGRAEYIYQPMDFNFARQCNIGAKAAKGEYILLLNDDIEIIQADWLWRLLGQAMQPHTGAVGAKLYYPHTKNIQHTGVINILPGPSHALSLMDDDESYYFSYNRINRNCIAVTGACLICSKEKYFQVGGLNEDLRVAYNDIDFCMKLYESGYYNVVRSDVRAYHYESVSRGNDLFNLKKLERLAYERNELYRLHDSTQEDYIDPFYNVNLTQMKTNLDINVNNNLIALRLCRLITKMKGRQCDYLLSIDRISAGNVIIIEGWSTTGSYERDEHAERSLLLRLRDDYIIEADAFPVEREDLVLESGCKKAGFKVMIDSSYFKGEARDFIFGMKYKYEDEVSYVWSDMVFEADEDDTRLDVFDLDDIGTADNEIDIEFGGMARYTDEVHLAGWSFYKKDKRHNDTYMRYMVYSGGTAGYRRITFRTTYRPDMVALYRDYKYMLYSGFVAVIPYDSIAENATGKWYVVYENMCTKEKIHKEINLPEIPKQKRIA